MNKNKEMLEVIEGFQNLTSKIKDENDSIKNMLKNKNAIIDACKKEYKKLFEEHNELKKIYNELEMRLEENKVEKIRKRKNNNNNNNNNNNKKKKVIIDYDYDDDDEADDEKDTDQEEEEEENNDDYEIVKVKKNKKPKQKKVKKNKKVRGIIDYINSRNV